MRPLGVIIVRSSTHTFRHSKEAYGPTARFTDFVDSNSRANLNLLFRAHPSLQIKAWFSPVLSTYCVSTSCTSLADKHMFGLFGRVILFYRAKLNGRKASWVTNEDQQTIVHTGDSRSGCRAWRKRIVVPCTNGKRVEHHIASCNYEYGSVAGYTRNRDNFGSLRVPYNVERGRADYDKLE